MPSPEKFNETLNKYVEKKLLTKELVLKINEGYQDISSKCKFNIRSAYFKRATNILDQEADSKIVKSIYEENACSKSGQRLKASKEFAKKYHNLSLSEKIDKIVEVPFMGKPSLNDDGTITVIAVTYYYDNLYHCACPTFNKCKEIDASITYCYCCGGHFKFHYEIMLEKKIEIIEAISSPLNSKGTKPCVFKMKIIE